MKYELIKFIAGLEETTKSTCHLSKHLSKCYGTVNSVFVL